MQVTAYLHLTQLLRCQIFALRSNGKTCREIGDTLKISHTTVSRELRRNSSEKLDLGLYYSPIDAQKLAEQRRNDSYKLRSKKISGDLEKAILEALAKRHSPEQIAGRLSREDKASISFKHIYAYIYANKAQGGDLYKWLRHKGRRYKPRASRAGTKLIPNRVDISERSKLVDLKTRSGDWEGDCIIGRGHSGLLVTLVERKSKLTRIVWLAHRDKLSTANAMISALHYIKFLGLPLHTITCDNGGEFAGHEMVTSVLGAKFYFARPYKSNDRGLSEHTNGLIREYFPKNMSFADITAEDVMQVENALNNRPRKVLSYMTPNEVSVQCAARRGIRFAADRT